MCATLLLWLQWSALVCAAARRLSTRRASLEGLHEVHQNLGQAVDTLPGHSILSSALTHTRCNESIRTPPALKSLGTLLQSFTSPAAAFTPFGVGYGLAGKNLHGPSSLGLATPHLSRMRTGFAVPSDSQLLPGERTPLSGLISQIVNTPQAPIHGASPWMPNEWLKDLFENANAPLSGNTNLQQVVDSLIKDVSNILQREPRWELFAEDFKVIGKTGTQLKGLEDTKAFFQLLNGICNHLDAKHDHEVRFVDGRGLFGPVDSFLVAKYKTHFNTVPSRHVNASIDVEAEILFHLNDQNKVDYMRIDNLLVNGCEPKFWPKVKLSDSTAVILEKVQEWAWDMKLREHIDALDRLEAVERAALLEEARQVWPTRKSPRICQQGTNANVYVVDFGSGYTRANLVQLSADGSATSKKVQGFRGIPLQRALRDPKLMEHLVDQIAKALPCGNILAGATAGVRSALDKGAVTQDQVHAFEELFARKLGSRAKFNVLTKEQEAKAEWTSVEYALRSMEKMGMHRVPKLDTVHGMLSSGGVSCQFACRAGEGGPAFLSFDNLIGDGFFHYDEQSEPVGADFAKILPKFEARVRENVAATRMTGLKGTYILTELWNALSFKGRGFGPEFLPYQSVPVADVLTAIERSLHKELSSREPLSRQQAKVILMATIGRIAFRELFDPSARLSFMDGDDMNWSVGWACMANIENHQGDMWHRNDAELISEDEGDMKDMMKRMIRVIGKMRQDTAAESVARRPEAREKELVQTAVRRGDFLSARTSLI